MIDAASRVFNSRSIYCRVSMLSFLSLNDNVDEDLLIAAGRVAPVVVLSSNLSIDLPTSKYFVLADSNDLGSFTVDDVTSWLNDGAEKAILPLALVKLCINILPKEKLLLYLDPMTTSTITDTIRSGISGLLLRTAQSEFDLSAIKRFFSGLDLYVYLESDSPPLPSTIRELSKQSITIVIPTSQLTLSQTTQTHINVGDAFLAPVSSDRPDGLFPTVVSAYDRSGTSLGLVYSSAESVRESIITGKGVYQSRKHGLWRKGDTSGATQDVISIRADCDHDSLEFSVIQHGSGFCHTGSASCFGEFRGFSALQSTIHSRRATAVPGSYTRRLFDDSVLLAAKIREEADELIAAKSQQDVAFEAADLLYFVLTYCISKNVNLVDIEEALDRKARKVTRRPGNVKPQYLNAISREIPALEVSSAPSRSTTGSDLIRMKFANLDGLDKDSRLQLLKRPVLKSDEMIEKVKPIVSEVRNRGDAALLEFTTKFDKAELTSTVIKPPFPQESIILPHDVKNAIDIAYQNILTFHQAQQEKATLTVETTPGVVCSRFARPIARVGLYVPGGTAILPSTALMLGVPAQVAGCREIVIATPPRPDGSIAPEVMYVAQLVGSSTILKAGGAQAVSAMAYGTKTVPKVDKILGPGNQWVTAAKMLVQNDTDALVSIDMPAGPSEVLVISDWTGNPAYVAADLLSQAEHGVDSQVVLVAVNLTPSRLAEIEAEVDKQAKALPRVDIVRESIAKSVIVSTSSLEQAIGFSNDYAPEHLILHLENARDVLKKVENAGSVFVGPFTPESCGDYASGTNHTLPTNGYARQFSGVNLQSFQKHITSQEITQEGLQKLGPVVVTLAECEGLSAHANAVRVRLQG
ncbi:histidine biosynthesis trifunctional-protein [Cantharellus anzutake]|uniref:histidine biosynthesis trifunctional-protein n=1 Tax=Cantharellus anzutake TaxID=1750568 RepID=UPI00190396C3|nr:histidine biosynthesis trifunctional-protein [Cantharellus anzutake]KAF8339111.1 histidine biosynthesis trifunctional-protein [Cantharellus anzutake]